MKIWSNPVCVRRRQDVKHSFCCWCSVKSKKDKFAYVKKKKKRKEIFATCGLFSSFYESAVKGRAKLGKKQGNSWDSSRTSFVQFLPNSKISCKQLAASAASPLGFEEIECKMKKWPSSVEQNVLKLLLQPRAKRKRQSAVSIPSWQMQY